MRQTALGFVAILVVVSAGCTLAPRPPEPATREKLVGSWVTDRPDGVREYLTLYESGVLSFQETQGEQPVLAAYGRWSFEQPTIDLHIVVRQNTDDDPLPNRIIAQRRGTALEMSLDGATTTWAPHDRFGAAAPGAAERAAKSEREALAQVEQAENAPQPEP
ncbi:MAG TPA: hypothetical protein VGM39_06860 [Kofleriaceae bacterium]